MSASGTKQTFASSPTSLLLTLRSGRYLSSPILSISLRKHWPFEPWGHPGHGCAPRIPARVGFAHDSNGGALGAISLCAVLRMVVPSIPGSLMGACGPGRGEGDVIAAGAAIEPRGSFFYLALNSEGES